MVLDGLVIQAGALVNGLTIKRVAMSELAETVTYYHIETEAHDVVLAAGAVAETFVDNVTRRRFDNFAEFAALYADSEPITESDLPRVQSVHQLPRATRERLEARAASFVFAASEAA